MKRLTAILLATLTGLTLTAASDIRTYTIQPTSEKITVDGVLNEAVWQTAPLFADFASLKETKSPIPETRVRITQNDSHLLLAVECLEPAMPSLVAKVTAHDGDVWMDDAIELFLDPSGKRDSFVQIIANANGTVMDGFVAGPKSPIDKSWESGAVAKTSRQPDRWFLEMAIPFANLPLGEPGCDWCLHVARERVAGERMYLTSLHGPVTSFHQSEFFDVLRGVKPTNSLIHVVDVGYGECLPGLNTAFLTLRSLAKDNVLCTVTTDWPDAPAKSVSLSLPPGAEERVNLPWNCRQTQGEEVRLNLQLEVGGAVLRRFAKIVNSVPKPLGDLPQHVFFQHANAPTIVPFHVNLASDVLTDACLNWELLDMTGKAVCSGLTAIRSRETCIRLFWTFQPEGRFVLKRTLISQKTQQPLVPSREDTISLVKTPWEE